MARISDQTSLATLLTSSNLLANQLDQVPQRPTAYKLNAIAPVTGIRVTVIVGKTILINDQLVPFTAVVSAQELRMAEIIRFGAYAGEPVIITLRNSTGGTVITTWSIDTKPA